jgi:hypothetical protein
MKNAGKSKNDITCSPISAILSAKSLRSSESMIDLMGVPRILTPYFSNIPSCQRDLSDKETSIHHINQNNWRHNIAKKGKQITRKFLLHPTHQRVTNISVEFYSKIKINLVHFHSAVESGLASKGQKDTIWSLSFDHLWVDIEFIKKYVSTRRSTLNYPILLSSLK